MAKAPGEPKHNLYGHSPLPDVWHRRMIILFIASARIKLPLLSHIRGRISGVLTGSGGENCRLSRSAPVLFIADAAVSGVAIGRKAMFLKNRSPKRFLIITVILAKYQSILHWRLLFSIK